MKGLTTLFIVLASAISWGQYFTINQKVVSEGGDVVSIFPVVELPSNPEAALKINTYLYYNVLEKVYDPKDSNPFSKVFPPEGAMMGYNDFAYEIFTNDEKFLSLSITYAYTGAYTEYTREVFTFLSSNGMKINLSDIIKEDRMSSLGKEFNHECARRIDKYLANPDPSHGDVEEQIELYTECKESFVGTDWIADDAFYIQDDALILSRGRCSNHALAALDKLWTFNQKYSFAILDSYLNANCKLLIESGKNDIWHAKIMSDKVLKGTLGDHPITLVLTKSYYNPKEVSGVYWYENTKKPVQLKGTLNRDGSATIYEKVNGKEVARIHGRFKGGIYDANWIKRNGTIFPFVVRVD